jgi:hypothetical protein
MEKLTINDLKNHLSEFQQILGCYGEFQLLKEFIVPDLLCQKLGIKPGSKLLFIYMGLYPHDHSIRQYLAWLEDEGGMLVDMYYEPSSPLLKDNEIMLTDGGFIGYGKIVPKPVIMEIVWKNGRPQAEEVRSGKIIELTDVPLTAPTEDCLEIMSDASFNIRYLLFGNPNFILSMPEDEEACLSYVNPNGRNSVCLDDSFCINMKTNGAKLKQLIIEAGNAAPEEFEKIIRSFDE